MFKGFSVGFKVALLIALTEGAVMLVLSFVGIASQDWLGILVNGLALTLIAGICIQFLVIRPNFEASRKSDSEATRQSEMVSALIDNLPAHITFRGADGRFVFVNRTMADDYGRDKSEFINRKVDEVGRPVKGPTLQSMAEEVLRTGVPVLNQEFNPPRFPGRTFLSSLLPLRRENGVVSISLDITDRKQVGEKLRLALAEAEQAIVEREREAHWRLQAEERLRDAVESIADGFILFDSSDKVALWNQRFANLYPELAPLLPNRPTAEELFRERHRVGAVGTFDIPVEEYVSWRIEMRHKQGGTPAVHRHSDGRWFRTTERRTREGGIVAISTDVTELKDRELELSEALRQAEAADRIKSEFLANMSHELRTPLNAVIGFSEIISSEMFGPIDTPRYKDYARDINASGAHLLDIINDILDLSKIGAGKLELDETHIDVGEIANACINIVKDRAEDGDIQIEQFIPVSLPSLFADDRKLKQILLNILSNAIKFCHAGDRITIDAGIEPSNDHGNELVVRVSDTGIGMSSAEVEVAMSVFGQVDSRLSRKHEGTGLGLPLTKALIELHGGQLELESAKGVGTTVSIRVLEKAAG